MPIFDQRSRHEVAEKIRRLAGEVAAKREHNRKWEELNYLETKSEAKLAEEILLSSQQKSLKPIAYLQPVIVSQRKLNHNVIIHVYATPSPIVSQIKIPEPMAVPSISNRKFPSRRRKRRSTVSSQIEELLTKGKNIFASDDDLEENVSTETLSQNFQEAAIKTIQDLPEKVLEKIFWHFNLTERCTILSLVCKAWYTILKNPIFWTNLEFHGGRVSTTDILRLIRTSSLLNTFKLTRVPDATVILQELCRDNPQMKEIALRYCSMNKIDGIHVLQQIPSSFPRLEVLDLEGTEFQSKKFFMEICSLYDLKSLNLGGTRYLHARDLMTISINCRRLNTLKIFTIPSNVGGKNVLADENFSFIINYMEQNLIHLEYDMQQMGNLSYLAIIRCIQLRTLCLANCFLLTRNVFQKFSRLGNLKNLTLTRAIQLSSKDFEDLLSDGSLKNVERLNVNGCWKLDGNGLRAIAKFLPNLKELSLESCQGINGNDFHRASLSKNLSTLNIAYCNVQSEDLPLILYSARQLCSLTIDKNMRSSSSIANLTAISPKLKIEVLD